MFSNYNFAIVATWYYWWQKRKRGKQEINES